MIVSFDAELWIWDARRDDSWTFVSLPVKRAVRKAEKLDAGDIATVSIELLDV